MARLSIITTLLVLLTHSQAMALDNPLTLNQAIKVTIENSPAYQAIQRDSARRKANAYDAEQVSNPELEMDGTFAEDNATRGVGAEVTFPLKPSQFGSRQKLAAAIRDISDLEKRMQILSLKHRVTRAYFDLWRIQEHIEFLENNLSFAEKTSRAVSDAAQSGQVAKADSSLFKAELLKYKDKLMALRARENVARIQLFRLMSAKLRDTNLKKPKVARLPERLNANRHSLPRDILKARQRAADMRVRVARQDSAFPEFSPRLSYTEGFDDDSRTIGVGVRMKLPLWNQNKGELARARAEQKYAARALQAQEKLGYQKLVNRRLDYARTLHARLRKYNKEILPTYHKSLKAKKQMFERGQASVVQLWQFHERLNDAQIKRLDVFEKAVAAEIELEKLIGSTLDASQNKTSR